MKNRIIALLLTLAFLLSLLPAYAVKEAKSETFTCGDYTYTLTDGKATITRWLGKGAKLEIPSELDDHKVIGIGDSAFYAKLLSTVTIPDTVISIDDKAFGCTELTEITIPDSVTYIGDTVFAYCYSLTSVTIPASVTEMGANPFKDCFALKNIRVSPENTAYAVMDGVLFDKRTKTLVCHPGSFAGDYAIPVGIRTIGSYAFSGCPGLVSVTIPDTVTAIGDCAFGNNGKLTSITIPASVTEMGANPFSAPRMTDVRLSPENVAYAVLDGVLFDKRTKTLICYPSAFEAVSYVVPNGITAIGDYAFWGCGVLSEIAIPSSITAIGDHSFEGCYALTEITIPSSITVIGDNTFSACRALKEITIPDSVISIGDEAFNGCISLENITIPASVTSIGDYAFWVCNELRSVSLPAYIENFDFQKIFGNTVETATFTVPRDSEMARLCKEAGVNYTYTDADDWLNG